MSLDLAVALAPLSGLYPNKSNIEPMNTAHNRILAELASSPSLTVHRLCLNLDIELPNMRVYLKELADLKKVTSNLGRYKLWEMAQVNTPKTSPTGRYDGAELKPFTGRPGSMDAYTLPSLDNGLRVAYSGPKPILTGQLVDRQNHNN
jgi:hypothetical protein